MLETNTEVPPARVLLVPGKLPTAKNAYKSFLKTVVHFTVLTLKAFCKETPPILNENKNLLQYFICECEKYRNSSDHR